jgi:hypothetical protein
MQPNRVPTRGGNASARKRNRSRALADLTAMDGAIGPQDWRAGQIREWLLLILRFAITRDPKDQAAVLAIAYEIDTLVLQGHHAPSFFRRTSSEVCAAISASDDPKRKGVLKRHLARIDDVRLRQAFQAVVDLEGRSPRASLKTKRQDLWAGLPR